MRLIYLLLLGAGLFLASCSSSYRSMQTTDDVYYSPSVQDDNYLAVYNEDERGSYNNYREDYEIRRGIRNPIYRNSFSLGLSFGSPFLYSPYSFNSFYSPFYSPFNSHYGSFYNSFYSPFYSFGSFYSPFYGSYYNPFYGPSYSMFYGGYPYFGNYYTSYYNYGHGTYISPNRINNGPRVTNLGAYNNSGTRSTIRNVDNPRTIGTAPTRSLNRDNNRDNNSPIRRIFAPRQTERVYTPSGNQTQGRFTPTTRSENSRPIRTERVTPVREQNTRPTAPVRTFEQNTTPVRTFEPQQRSNSTPVRRDRKSVV